MKILIVQGEETIGDALRNKAVIEFYKNLGHTVDTISLAPVTCRYPRWQRAAVLLYNVARHPRSGNALGRADLHLALRAADRALLYTARQIDSVQQKYDLIQAETTICGAVFPMLRRKRAKWVVDVHGLWAAEMELLGAPDAEIERARRLERNALAACDICVVVTDAMRDYLTNHMHLDRNRILVVPNGTYLYDSKPIFYDPLRLVYGGLFVKWQRVIDFVEACVVLQKSENFKCFMLGSGPYLLSTLQAADMMHLNYCYLGHRTYEEAKAIFSRMNVGVIPMSIHPSKYVASPMKLLDYAACGLPVVAARGGPWADVVEKYEFGMVVPPEDAMAIAEGARAMKDPEVWNRFSVNAKKYVQDHALWSHVLQPLSLL